MNRRPAVSNAKPGDPEQDAGTDAAPQRSSAPAAEEEEEYGTMYTLKQLKREYKSSGYQKVG